MSDLTIRGKTAIVGLGETILMIERPGWNVVNTSVAFAARFGR